MTMTMMSDALDARALAARNRAADATAARNRAIHDDYVAGLHARAATSSAAPTPAERTAPGESNSADGDGRAGGEALTAQGFMSHEARVDDRAREQAATLLAWSTSWLPPKIVDEVVGNAFERMEKMRDEGVSHWRIQAYALRRIFWCYVYTLRDVGILAAIWRVFAG